MLKVISRTDPHLSFNDLAVIFKTSPPTISKMCAGAGIKKWKLVKTQNLTDAHRAKRLKACQNFMKKMDADPDWIDNVWCGDEKNFILEHTFNHHNGFLGTG